MHCSNGATAGLTRHRASGPALRAGPAGAQTAGGVAGTDPSYASPCLGAVGDALCWWGRDEFLYLCMQMQGFASQTFPLCS